MPILWCDKIRYLGIYVKSAGVFRCSYDNAKHLFYRAFNAIFGKVGRLASVDVIIQLLNILLSRRFAPKIDYHSSIP